MEPTNVPEKKKMGHGVKATLWICLIVLLILVFTAAGSGGNNSSTPTTVASDTSTASAPPPDPIATACGASSTPKTIDYKQLIKDPGSFQGKTTMFTGKIFQIQESGDTGAMRFSVDQDAYGNWSINDVVLVQYEGHTPAVQDDIVTVIGVLEGTQTYTSQANYEITLPLVYACSIKMR